MIRGSFQRSTTAAGPNQAGQELTEAPVLWSTDPPVTSLATAIAPLVSVADPIVSMGFALRGDFGCLRVPGYLFVDRR